MTTFDDIPEPSNEALLRSRALRDLIRQEIEKYGKPISFATFMDMALYHPEYGYYTSPSFDLGKQGDFTTAPEISPLFTYCFVNQYIQLANSLNNNQILEIGAGTGRLAGDFLFQSKLLGQMPEHYFIYEISVNLRKKQQAYLQSTHPTLYKHVTWLDQLPQDFKGLIIANEVLDALPVSCFSVEQNTIKERCVTWDQHGFQWQLSDSESYEFQSKTSAIHQRLELAPHYQSEINLTVSSFIEALANTLSQGVILLADYGYGEREYYHPERQRGTLTCFYQHRHHTNPLVHPGLQDITAHVDFTNVAEEAVRHGLNLNGYTTQAAFLLACGLLAMAAKLEETMSPIDVFNLHHAIKLLTMPTEMGERIKVMALSKNYNHPSPLLGFTMQDRRWDL